MSSATNSTLFENLHGISTFIIGIIDILLIPMILIGNFMVLFSFAKFRFLRTTTNVFIASLSCADTLLGTVTLPLYALLYLYRDINNLKYPCVLKFVSVLCSLCASLLSLVAISIDRYISIIKPLQYQVIMTRQRARKMVVGLWVYTLTMCIIPVFWNYFDETSSDPCNFFVIFPRGYTIFVSYVSMFIALIVALCLYVQIFIVAKRHRKRYLERRAQLGGKSVKQFEKDTKSAKSMALILFLFFVFWLPLQAVGPLGYTNIDHSLAETIKDMALCLAMTNSFVNPIIYCWLRKDFKLAFRKLFKIDTKNMSISGSFSDGSRRSDNNESNAREMKENKENTIGTSTEIGKQHDIVNGV